MVDVIFFKEQSSAREPRWAMVASGLQRVSDFTEGMDSQQPVHGEQQQPCAECGGQAEQSVSGGNHLPQLLGPQPWLHT